MSDLKAARPTQFLTVLLALLATACSDLGGPPAGEPEQPGVLLVPHVQNALYSNPVWTRDGTELVFVNDATNPPVINAVNVSTHSVRQLYTPPNTALMLSNFHRSNGAEWIYFEVTDIAPLGPTNPRLQRLNPSSGAVEAVPATFPGYPNDFVDYADERFLVSNTGFFNLQTGTRIDHPAGSGASFSPDGTRVLYGVNSGSNSPPSPTLISTIDGSSQQLHSTDYFVVANRWIGNSPQFLSTTNDYPAGIVRLYEVDGVTGTRRDIAQFTSTLAYIYASWSPDNQILGAWIDEGDIGKGTDRTVLYIIRPGTTPTIAVTVRPSWEAGPPSRPVFSPDSRSLAYFYPHADDSHSLYLKSGI
jgi:hypothetical protein